MGTIRTLRCLLFGLYLDLSAVVIITEIILLELHLIALLQGRIDHQCWTGEGTTLGTRADHQNVAELSTWYIHRQDALPSYTVQ